MTLIGQTVAYDLEPNAACEVMDSSNLAHSVAQAQGMHLLQVLFCCPSSRHALVASFIKVASTLSPAASTIFVSGEVYTAEKEKQLCDKDLVL